MVLTPRGSYQGVRRQTRTHWERGDGLDAGLQAERSGAALARGGNVGFAPVGARKGDPERITM